MKKLHSTYTVSEVQEMYNKGIPLSVCKIKGSLRQLYTFDENYNLPYGGNIPVVSNFGEEIELIKEYEVNDLGEMLEIQCVNEVYICL